VVILAAAEQVNRNESIPMLDENDESLEALAALPSEEELLERLREAEPFAMKRSSAKIIRKDRGAA